MNNRFLEQAFNEGHILETLLGEFPYFIRDRIDPDSPNRDLIVKQLLHWADDPYRKRDAARAIDAAIDISLNRGDLRSALDILLCYELSIRSTGIRLPLNVSAVVGKIGRWLRENYEKVVSDPDLLYFVNNMLERFPELGRYCPLSCPPQKMNPRTQERQEGGETPTGEPPEAE